MQRAFVGAIVLGLAFPAQAKQFKAGKATDETLLAELVNAQAPVQQEILSEIEKRRLLTACPALAERNDLDDSARVRARSLAVMDALNCPDLLDAVILAVGRDRIPDNRSAALDLLRRHGDTTHVPILLTVITQDRSAPVRHKALTLALETGWEGAGPVVQAALRDDDNSIVHDAATVLVALDDPQFHQALFEEVPTLGPFERASVMAIWEDHALPGDTGYLLSLLTDSHSPVAISAIHALTSLGDAAVVPVLSKRLAREKDKDVRKALKKAIKTLE